MNDYDVMINSLSKIQVQLSELQSQNDDKIDSFADCIGMCMDLRYEIFKLKNL